MIARTELATIGSPIDAPACDDVRFDRRAAYFQILILAQDAQLEQSGGVWIGRVD
jgi:hypothetical protein